MYLRGCYNKHIMLRLSGENENENYYCSDIVSVTLHGAM